MSINTRVLSCLFCWLVLGLASVQAQAAGDAGDQYLKGYQLKNEGEQFESAGKIDAAVGRYQQAYQIIGSVAQNYPTWQPEVVQFRLQALQKKLEQLKMGGAVVTPAAPPSAPAVDRGAYTPVPPPSAQPPGSILPAPQSNTLPVQTTGAATAGDPFAALRIAMAQKDQEIAQKNDLIRQRDAIIQKSQTDNEIVKNAYIAQAEAKQKAEKDVAILSQQNRDLQTKISSVEEQVKNAKAAADAEGKAKLAATQQELARLTNEKKLVEGMMADKNSALEEIKKALASVEKERDSLKADATKLQANNATLQKDNKDLQVKVTALEHGSTNAEAYSKLMAENTRLKGELERARQQVDELKSSGEKKDTQIAQLKTQITSIQGELVKVQSENTEYQKEVADLTVKLKEMNSGLASKKSGTRDTKGGQLTEENKMLRAIITRQLRFQERQRQAKEMVIAEMQKMKETSKTMLENLEDLTATRVMVTAEEEALFTKPQLDLIYSFESGSANRATLVSTSATSKHTDAKGGAAGDASVVGGPSGPAVEKLLTEAAVAIEKEDFKKAEAAYQDVLRADPKNSGVLTSFGVLELRLKKYEEAEVQLKKAIVYDPDNATALYRLATCYYYEGRMDDSRQNFELSLQKKADNAKAHHYLGIIAGKFGKRDVAEAEFKQALAIDPDYGDAHFNLAVLYATGEPPNWALAKQYYQSALSKGIKSDPAMDKLLKGKGSANSAKQPASPEAVIKASTISSR